ncbi:hypothetical protein Y032_0047g1516 [Ancylostoma ceylanicum]|uniref:Uncharacterized protein n=1 Tax=Ancylostoma ceylanicum TaxID=53326 RepID=A0A016UB19_9BILA|nr:hypothetical protein Y032_0047g1516 [Ancylostoma ceylanicum]
MDFQTLNIFIAGLTDFFPAFFEHMHNKICSSLISFFSVSCKTGSFRVKPMYATFKTLRYNFQLIQKHNVRSPV